MESIISINDRSLDSVQILLNYIKAGLPKLLMAILIIIIGWLIIKLICFILAKVLKLTKMDHWANKLNEANLFGETTVNIKFSVIIIKFVRWFLIIIIVMTAADALGMNMISIELSNLLRYLPKLFTALAIFLIGAYIGSSIRKAIRELLKSLDLSGSKMISNMVFYLIIIIVSITSMNQAGVNTEIITNNLTLILGTMLVSVSLALGLGSRDVVLRLLFGFYSKKNLEVGQTIVMRDIEGVIETIDNISLVINTKSGKVIIPIKDIVDEKILIKEKNS